MVGAVCDVDSCSSRSSSSSGKRAFRLALKDELQREKIAAKRAGNTRRDLPLVFRTDDGNVAASHYLIRPRRRRDEIYTCLVHVDNERGMNLHCQRSGQKTEK
jgi:hypothetical protein